MPRPLARLLALVAAASVISCLPFPIGDPSKSRADPRLNGAWRLTMEEEEDEWLWVLVESWDEHTHRVLVMEVAGDPKHPEPKSIASYKAWLTKLGAHTWLTLQERGFTDVLEPGRIRESPYVAVRVEFAKDRLLLRPLDGASDAPLAKARDRAQAEELLRKRADDDALYAGPPRRADRVAGDDLARIRSAFRSFRFEL